MTVKETYERILAECDRVREDGGFSGDQLVEVGDWIEALRTTDARERTRRALLLQMVRYNEWLGFDWDALQRQAEAALSWVAVNKG